MLPSRSRPEFFLDRSLGGRAVGQALRDADWDVHTHREVYGSRDEQIPDAEWLERCGREGWVVLTMDRRIRYRRTEIAAIRRFRVKAFALSRGNLLGSEQADRLIRHAERIAAACAEPGPFVYAVHADRIVRVFPA